MKKVVLFLLIISINHIYANDFLFPESSQKLLTQTDIHNKSKAYLRYARNEIYARHGYPFEDKDLDLYFDKQSWYHKQQEKELNLSDIEKKNVAFLLKNEKSYKEDLYEIIYSTIFHNGALVYITLDSRFMSENHSRNRGLLLYLDQPKQWIVNCESVPPEYVIASAKNLFDLEEERRALNSGQFEIVNFMNEDSSLTLFQAHLYGPSDDHVLLFYGFDKTGTFKQLFTIPAYEYDVHKLNDVKVLVTARIRKDLHGTSFHNQEYIYDTSNQEFYEIPELFIDLQDPWPLTTKKKLDIYYDARSAANQNRQGIIGNLAKNVHFVLLKFYRVEGDGAVKISYNMAGKKKCAWLPQNKIHWDYVDGLCAAD